MSSSKTVAKAEKTPFQQWIGSRKIQKRLLIISFMFIPMLLLIVFTYVPFLKMIQFSFYDMKYLGDKVFVGLKNYKEIFSEYSGRFYPACPVMETGDSGLKETAIPVSGNH